MRHTIPTGRMTPISWPHYTSPDTPWTTIRQVQNMAKTLKKAPPSKKRGKKIQKKKISKCRKKEKVSTVEKKQKKFKSIFLENQVFLFDLILYTSTILSNYKTFFFLYISHICHPHPLDYTFLIGQRINGKDIEILLPNTNDLRLAYNTKAGYICTPGRLDLYTI